MFCPKCAQQIADNAKFCEFCGCKIDGAAAAPVAPVEGEEVKFNDAAQGAAEQPVNPAQNYSQPYTPNTVYYAPPAPVKTGSNGVGIASMICGIASILCCCTMVVSILAGAAAVVLGIIGLKGPVKGYAIAGIITGAVGLLGGVFLLVTFIVGGGLQELLETGQYYWSYNI